MTDVGWYRADKVKLMLKLLEKRRVTVGYRFENRIFSERKARLFTICCTAQHFDLIENDTTRKILQLAESMAIDVNFLNSEKNWLYHRNVFDGANATVASQNCYRSEAEGNLSRRRWLALISCIRIVPFTNVYNFSLYTKEETKIHPYILRDIIGSLEFPIETRLWPQDPITRGSLDHTVRRVEDNEPRIGIVETVTNQNEINFCPTGDSLKIERNAGGHRKLLTKYPEYELYCTKAIRQMIQEAYDNCNSKFELENDRLQVISDALEEAGCTSKRLLAHLRNNEVHYKGCHALDPIYMYQPNRK